MSKIHPEFLEKVKAEYQEDEQELVLFIIDIIYK